MFGECDPLHQKTLFFLFLGSMSNERSIVKYEKGSDVVETVIVAVKASRDISKDALVWTLTHVAQPGHCITLIVVMPSLISGKIYFSVLS